LIALVALVFAAVAIVIFGSRGAMRGDVMRLYLVSDQARDVMRGTEVWLSGQKIGVVSRVDFLPPSTDTTAHVVMSLRVEAGAARGIRRDSRADVQAGASLLGPNVVYIEPGTPESPAVSDGDTLHAAPQHDVAMAMARLNEVTSQFPALMTDARAVLARFHDRSGTIGAFLREGLPPAAHALNARFNRLKTRDGTGVAARGFMRRARIALARTDSIRALLASPASSLGRFRRDSSLASAVADVRDELADLSARVDDPSGTVGRVSSDSALTRAVAEARREMAALLTDIRRRPVRYLNF
jgi:phospholipid/cholesterol/gamma-HCH transport system substrate-binding protein